MKMNEDEAARDEITVFDIIGKLWRRRGLIIITTLIFLGLGVLAVAYMTYDNNRPVIYYVSLRSIKNSEYPNGTSFSPQDLTVPQVLARLRDRFKIDDSLVIRDAVSVSYDSPISQGIAKKYENRLAAKNLSQTEIDELNAAYLNELKSATSSGIRIEVDYQSLGMDRSMGSAIAIAIPEIWNDVYKNQFRIFDDTTLESAAVTWSDEKLDSTASVLVANARLEGMEHGLGLIQGDNRLASLVTDDGFSPADVAEELQRFKTEYFNAVYAASFGQDNTIANIYVRDLKFEIENLQRTAAGLDKLLADLSNYQGAARGSSGPTPPADASNGSSNVIQLGESSLNEIVNLANQASMSQYVQDILTRRQTIVEEISKRQMNLDRASSLSDNVVQAGFRQRAAAELERLTSTYHGLLNKARARSAERSGQLYAPLSSPRVIGSFIPRRSLIVLLMSVMVGGLFAVVLALLLPGRRVREAGLADQQFGTV